MRLLYVSLGDCISFRSSTQERIVLLTHGFIAAERAAQGTAARPPPFSAVARTLVYEMATQIAESEGLGRLKAQQVAEAMVKGLTDW